MLSTPQENVILGLPSYVRDSLHLIEMLEHLSITPDVLLVTCDFESLYTNIAHKDGIRATTHFLEKSTSEEPAHRAFLGSRETCIQFVDTLNNNDLNIHLTYTISDDTVDFLDLRLCKEHERITTSLFRKSTATNNLLHYQSFHPTHMKRGIPKGQFLRLRCNCTDFRTASADLTARFQKRGYPRKLISHSYEEAKNTDRMELFTPKPKTRDGKVHLITRYNNQWSALYKILENHWFLLTSDHRLTPYMDDKPKIIAHKAPSLKDQLVHSHFQRPTRGLNRGIKLKGTHPCGQCNVCPYMLGKDNFMNDAHAVHSHATIWSLILGLLGYLPSAPWLGNYPIIVY
ncbi:uncharacterized protein LOC122945473 isoform X2 [Bufo gargarizans]|uniref:uncharacterized protein LOC122945473 isoform X2 n=1 Tax=Bufo gargarizans TaxID=30331 RepID=UPI001CF2177E|nr:uncharacterized protein LOC122945473 isoform X2 [Bufo gargarizans]